MDEIDDLKILWHQQSNATLLSDKLKFSSEQALSRYQKRLRRNNIFGTIGMAMTVIFLASLMFVYQEENWLFYASILGVITLCAGVVWMLWSRTLNANKKLELSASDYIDYQLGKLMRSKKMITYSPLYGLLLGVLVNAYGYSLISHASGEFVFWITNANWFYIVLVTFISQRVKMRRFNREVQPIVDELTAFKS